MNIRLKSPEDIKKLEESGRILAFVLKALKENTKAGVRLSELDNLAENLLYEAKAKAAFFGYAPEGAEHGFPGHICASVNDQIVHGVPGKYKLKNGDILSIDFGVNYNGYITDAALTVPIGEINPQAEKLLKTTYQALEEAIKICKPGNYTGDIGWIIEQVITKNNFNVIKNLTGHGVGFELHENPTIFNFGEKGTGLELQEGLVIAIEPLVSMGSEDIKEGSQESYVTADGSLSAHFEKTIAITKNGPKILTPWDR
jgi:methionyl aminopeptidase